MTQDSEESVNVLGEEPRVRLQERSDASVDPVNCTFALFDGEIEVCSGMTPERWIKVRASTRMQLSPTPRVLIEVPEAPVLLSGNLYNSDRLSTIRVPGGPGFEVRTLEVRIGERNSSLAMPIRQPVTSITTGAKLQSVKFDILNFPSLFRRDRPAVLEEGPWRIEIRPHQRLDAIKKVLKADSGYAITHEGSMRRADDRPFTGEEAESVLRTLHHFLSFARGGSSGLAFMSGSDKSGNKAWEQWGAYSTYPWFALCSWLDHRHNNEEELAQAFPGFMRMMKAINYSYGEHVPAALYWYLRSNESNNPYTSIVLAQAALERLSREILSEGEWSKSGTKDNLGEALKKASIDTALPKSCKALSPVSKTDGPGVLVNTRNNLIHADVRQTLSLDSLSEVQNLGQWYVELLLLRRGGYRGRYANRLTYTYDGIYEPEWVPWARES